MASPPIRAIPGRKQSLDAQGGGAVRRDQAPSEGEPKPSPSLPAFPLKPGPNARYVEAPAGAGYPPSKSRSSLSDNKASGEAAPTIAIESLAGLP